MKKASSSASGSLGYRAVMADALENLEAAAITAVSAALGVPVPPTVARSVFKAIGALVGGVSDLGVAALEVPTEWLRGRRDEIRAESAGRAELTSRMVEVAANEIGADQALAARAAAFLGRRFLNDQA